jgi:hypothetical protein
MLAPAIGASIDAHTAVLAAKTRYVGALRWQRGHQPNLAYCRKFRDSIAPKLGSDFRLLSDTSQFLGMPQNDNVNIAHRLIHTLRHARCRKGPRR